VTVSPRSRRRDPAPRRGRPHSPSVGPPPERAPSSRYPRPSPPHRRSPPRLRAATLGEWAALGGGGGGSWFDVSAEVDVDPDSAEVKESPVYVKNFPPEQEPVRTPRAIAARMTRPATFRRLQSSYRSSPAAAHHPAGRTVFQFPAPGFASSSPGCSGGSPEPGACRRAAGSYGGGLAARILEESGEGWTVPVDGWRVDRLAFDFQVRLWFLSEESPLTGSIEIVLESPFSLSLRGDELELDPNGPPEALSPVLALLRRTIHEALVEKDGTLRLVFREGGRLRCEPHPQWEAWQLNDPDGGNGGLRSRRR
jgi:hypothetical protein